MTVVRFLVSVEFLDDPSKASIEVWLARIPVAGDYLYDLNKGYFVKMVMLAMDFDNFVGEPVAIVRVTG